MPATTGQLLYCVVDSNLDCQNDAASMSFNDGIYYLPEDANITLVGNRNTDLMYQVMIWVQACNDSYCDSPDQINDYFNAMSLYYVYQIFDPNDVKQHIKTQYRTLNY